MYTSVCGKNLPSFGNVFVELVNRVAGKSCTVRESSNLQRGTVYFDGVTRLRVPPPLPLVLQLSPMYCIMSNISSVASKELNNRRIRYK